jgi:hypothetical protein
VSVWSGVGVEGMALEIGGVGRGYMAFLTLFVMLVEGRDSEDLKLRSSCSY